MQSNVSPQTRAVRHIRYLSPARWVLIGLAGIMGIVIIVFGIPGLRGDFLGVQDNFCGLLIAGALLISVVAVFCQLVWMIETRPEGVFIRYGCGISRRIRYEQIIKAGVMGTRQIGPALRIETDNPIWSRVSVAVGFYRVDGSHPPDALLAEIARAANLPRFSRSLQGWPTYDHP